MKGFYCIAALFLVAVCQGRIVDKAEDVLNRIDEEGYEEYKEFLQKKCEKVGHKFDEEKFKNAVESAQTCLEPHVPKTKDSLKELKDKSSEDMCSTTRVSIRKCFEDLVHVMEPCIEEEEKYVPNFILTAFDGLFDLICEKDGEIFDEIFDDETFECIEKIYENHEKVKDCDADFELLGKKYTDDVVFKKDDVCHEFTSINKCLNEIITSQCPNDKKLHNVLNKVHKAITSPCA